MPDVLHMTPHMGGGVGKVLAGLAGGARRNESSFRHRILCLEKPEKSLFIDQAKDAGAVVVDGTDASVLAHEVCNADIVQIEFWNHPTIVRALSSIKWPAVRLLLWSHVSGLHFPAFPKSLTRAVDRLVFTSPCSLEGPEVQQWLAAGLATFDVISSAGGLDGLTPSESVGPKAEIRMGYIGSLNYSKLHPDVGSFLAAMPDGLGPLHFYGDRLNEADLLARAAAAGRPDLFNFHGFVDDVPAVLADLDVLVYLLNPFHYGTAENALVEAMAAGVVPVVFGNPAERHIVKDGETGFVVNTPLELSKVMAKLNEDRSMLKRMSLQASSDAHERFNYRAMAAAFDKHYQDMIVVDKRQPDFQGVFGASPSDWFLAFVRDNAIFSGDGQVQVPSGHLRHAFFEQTKGSVYHFLKNNPDDPLLKAWAENLDASGAGGVID